MIAASFLKTSAGLLLAVSLAAGFAHAQASTRDASQLYTEFCAGCHGQKLEGGKAGSLLDNVWKHGGTAAELTNSIQHGLPLDGMPAFSPTLSDAEVHAMVVFITETRVRVGNPQAQAAEPLPTGVQHSELHSYRVESVAEGLDVPWSLAFLPDGRMLVTERVGRLRVIEHGELQPTPIAGIPKPVVRDEGGMLSVVIDPDFVNNGWVYLSFSDSGNDQAETAMTKIVRGHIKDGVWTDEQTVFGIPREQYPKGYMGFGCRLVFQGDYLFFTLGDRDLPPQAQDLTKPWGKTHRVFHDGSVPPDNPFVHTPGAVGSIWTYGHRNQQGIAIDPVTGDLWASEHGPRGGDELNHLGKGLNYGWPVITYGMNYDGTAITDHTEQAGMEQPVLYWTPSIAVSQIGFYRGGQFPKWKNNLFVGSLAQQEFWRMVVDGARVTHRELIFKHLGRIRDVVTGPDGLLYIALEIPGHLGRIIRLVPAE